MELGFDVLDVLPREITPFRQEEITRLNYSMPRRYHSAYERRNTTIQYTKAEKIQLIIGETVFCKSFGKVNFRSSGKEISGRSRSWVVHHEFSSNDGWRSTVDLHFETRESRPRFYQTRIQGNFKNKIILRANHSL